MRKISHFLPSTVMQTALSCSTAAAFQLMWLFSSSRLSDPYVQLKKKNTFRDCVIGKPIFFSVISPFHIP